jgi:hypothetical protein
MKRDRATAAQIKEFIHRVTAASGEVLYAYERSLWVRPIIPAQRNVPEGPATTVPIQIQLLQHNSLRAEFGLSPVNHEIQSVNHFAPVFAFDLLRQCFDYIREVNAEKNKDLLSLAASIKQVGERTLL